MTTKPPRLPDPCTPEQAAEWLTYRSDEAWTEAAVLSQLFAVDAQSIAYERGIVLVLIRPGTKLLRLNNGEWMPFETVSAMHLEAETGAALAYVFNGGEHYDASGGVIHLDPADDSFIGQLASLGHATPRLLVDRDGTRYHVTEPVQASDIRLRKDWVNELLPGTVFLSEFDRLAMGIERGVLPDIASMLDPIQDTDTDTPPAAKEGQETPKPKDNTAEICDVDTYGMVSWQVEALEHWPEISATQKGGKKVTPTTVARWLKKNGKPDRIPKEQPLANELLWLDNDGNPHSVKIRSIGSRLSEWRRAGKIHAA